MPTVTQTNTTTVARQGLPPGQRRIDWFPRFGVDLSGPPPPILADPVIEIRGPGIATVEVPLDRLAMLPRRELVADFHCVSGWTATDIRWDGVAFADVYRELIVPALPPDIVVTHLTFVGLDRVRAVLQLDDALADDVLVADQLDGRPLDGDHGAPVRLVSPAQYGYMSVKHLCRIDVHTSEPDTPRSLLDRLLRSHSRARVWEEERHGDVPGWFVRPIYRVVKVVMLRRVRPRR